MTHTAHTIAAAVSPSGVVHIVFTSGWTRCGLRSGDAWIHAPLALYDHPKLSRCRRCGPSNGGRS